MSAGRILRYSLQERIIHALAALAYLYLLITGLAFYTPRLYWLAALVGGGPTARSWHPWAGLIFTFTILWMWRAWRSDLRITEEDRAWNQAVMHYIRHEDDQVPAAGRFNSGQKQFYWIMLWAGIVLLLTGVVLWFTDWLPWSFRIFRYLSVLLHDIAFLATVAAFIVHVYMGMVVVPGGMGVITRGEVSPAWAARHHRLWYNQTTGAEATRK